MLSETLLLPIDTEESAHFDNSDNLLPQQLYKDLTKLVKEARDKAKPTSDDNKKHRSHHAVLIDGERGTGKTSVLVNLPSYLNKNVDTKPLFDELMILDPIDPTLLEDGDSLFLTIIVASVLSNEQLKETQRRLPDKAIELNRALDRLATALESAEPDSDAKGMQKIRNMYDNHNLETCVRDFFDTVLQLMGKQLLVLPIDDVDTSLNRAFENLEIVRRYLTSPNILPIIAGDLMLYQEVIWRDFHGRMTKESQYNKKQAFRTAQELAHEYQRKVMPHSRRLVMPGVNTYLNNSQILLAKGKERYMSLPNFYTWLEIYVGGPVNGLEDSTLPIPIKSIRALTQLLNRCQEVILALPKGITEATSKLQVKRFWQMPNVPAGVVERFHESYEKLSREATEGRYFADVYKEFKTISTSIESGLPQPKQLHQWDQILANHFMHEKDAGALNLVLRAYEDWFRLNYHDLGPKSVLDSPIFQPLVQNKGEWENFTHSSNLDEWLSEERVGDSESPEKGLKKKLPEAWLQKLKNSTTILPYPLPQVGSQTNASWQKKQSYNGKQDTLFTLLTNYNFYTNSNQSQMLNSGRIFEIIIHSLVSPLEVQSLLRIAHQAPFYSTSDLAPTKVLSLDVEEGLDEVYDGDFNGEKIGGLIDLSEDIYAWRQRHNLEQFRLSPWLVYKVLNKVFSQLTHFSSKEKGIEAYTKASLDLLALTFNSTWAAFASFEKGSLFGLPLKVATSNINTDSNKDFQANPHFRININPFSPQLVPLLKLRKDQDEGVESVSSEVKDRDNFGRATRTVTYMLADHPLRKWITKILDESKEKGVGSLPLSVPSESSSPGLKRKAKFNIHIREKYGLTLPKGREVDDYVNWIESESVALEKCDLIISDEENDYSGSPLYKALKKAVKEVQKRSETE